MSGLILTSLMIACLSDSAIGIREGTWILSHAKKNNIETRMLDGVYFKIFKDSIVSNVINNEKLSTFKQIGNTVLTDSNDKFDIIEQTDTSLVLEVIKNRNLFTMYLKPQ